MQLPARFGRYELEKFLGGGMSHVYRARDTVIGRTVAVKILTEQGCQDQEAKQRFLLEARMCGNIQHENIVAVHDYGEEQGRPFIVMEFLTGQDLRDAIQKGETGDLDNKLRIALQIARAMEFVHSKKIIHRDIKPENVHLDNSGRAKLMDFGIAKTEGLTMTKAGFALGTPYYMAPEQVLGHPATDLVDVYAYGILLYEIFCGKKPITGETVERLFYAILNEPIDIVPLREGGAPDFVIDMVMRCTSKKPPERPQSFSEICQVLERQRQAIAAGPLHSTVPVATTAPAATGGRKIFIALAAVLLVGVVGIASYVFSRPKPGPDPPKPPVVKELAAVLATDAGEMALVPAGVFLAGEDKQQFDLPAFYIDKTEVTNAMYRRFCDARGRPIPPGFAADKPDLPVVNITIVDAQEFAKWAGKRLPTAYEWEKAARGTDGRAFPWGDQADPSKANVKDNPSKPTQAVAASALAEGASPFGVLQMAGNVWEYADDLRTPSEGAIESFKQLMNPSPTVNEPWYVVKGGSFAFPLAAGVTHQWVSMPARFSRNDVGFRCAKDPPRD